jgi:hypothetical protein
MDLTWLNRIAPLMREYAAGHPWQPGMRIANYRRITADGLLVEYYLDARTDDCTLALAREGRDVGEAERTAALDAFGAPLLLTRHLPLRVDETLHVRKFAWKREYARRENVPAPAHGRTKRAGKKLEGATP